MQNIINEKLGSEERLKWAQDCINRGFQGTHETYL